MVSFEKVFLYRSSLGKRWCWLLTSILYYVCGYHIIAVRFFSIILQENENSIEYTCLFSDTARISRLFFFFFRNFFTNQSNDGCAAVNKCATVIQCFRMSVKRDHIKIKDTDCLFNLFWIFVTLINHLFVIRPFHFGVNLYSKKIREERFVNFVRCDMRT